MLLATKAGLGDGETPVFPVSIFKVKDGVNYKEGDPNYDLFKLAIKVSAERLFPNFSFLDSPQNLPYYVEGNPDTEVAYMGCVQGDELLTYKIDGELYVEGIQRAYNRVVEKYPELEYGVSKYIDLEGKNVTVYDTTTGKFVKMKKIIKNPNKNNWLRVKTTNGRVLELTEDHPLQLKRGRVFARDFEIGDEVYVTYDQYSEETTKEIDEETAYLLGKEVREGSKEVPNKLYQVTKQVKEAFIKGYVGETRGGVVESRKEVILQIMALKQSMGIAVEVQVNNNLEYTLKEVETKVETATIKSIEKIELDECSYDIETESDMFDISGVLSHNCRTRVMANSYDPTKEIVTGRGNLSFTSVNLPRLGIEAKGDLDKFYKDLDRVMELVSKQLLDRLEIQSRKKVKNFPFLMGQGVWIESDTLGFEDTVREIIKHGTLSIGFIGLAETLKALIGEHHGESKEADKLGFEIISHMREFCDNKAAETGLNFTLLATPKSGHLCRNM